MIHWLDILAGFAIALSGCAAADIVVGAVVVDHAPGMGSARRTASVMGHGSPTRR